MVFFCRRIAVEIAQTVDCCSLAVLSSLPQTAPQISRSTRPRLLFHLF